MMGVRKSGKGKRKIHMVYIKQGEQGLTRLIGCFGQEDEANKIGSQWGKWGFYWCIVSLPLNVEFDPGANISELKWVLGASPYGVSWGKPAVG